jgi:antitoxin SocA-like protein
MASLKDAVAYLLLAYPNKADLSNGRVTKLVYLSDWRHVLVTGKQITSVEWVFDNFGPFVWDVMDTARAHPELFEINETETFLGSPKRVLRCINLDYRPRLSESEQAAIDHVIKATHTLSWEAFIKLVYSTYPVVASDRYSVLDLEVLAREYKETVVYRDVVPQA